MTKVLIVDDEVYNREILTKVLSKEGMETYEAINGEESLLKIGKDSFDIILMDLMMPIMDGFTAIKVLREELHCSTPIIVISAICDEETMNRMKDMGINAYLTKPFDLVTLVQTIKETLKC